MLGLSLAIRVGKRVLGGLIDSLMSAVKGRATYSENIADSKQVLKDIDNYELLDKASILLTPTAYSDARVHSVKTYTGDELVVNGGFDADSDWSKSEGWTIVNGKATHDGLSSYKKISQLITTVIGNTYRYEATVSNLTTSQVYLMARVNNEFGTIIFNNLRYDNGNYVFYFKALSTTTAIVFQNGNSNEVSIDNSSVVDVSSDFDFDRASSATRINSDGLVQDMQSITDPELVLNGDFEELGDDLVTNGTFDTDSDWSKSSQSTISNGTARILSTDGSFQFLKQSGYTSTQGETVKITIDIVDVQSGQLKVFFDGGANTQNIPSTVGTHTVYLVNDGTVGTLAITRISGVTDITIDNVSVQKVDPNDRWTLGTGWSVEDGKIKADDAAFGVSATQSISFVDGNIYEVTFTISDYSSGGVTLNAGSGATGTNRTANGTYTEQLTHSGANILYLRPSTNNTTLSIDNISVKDITFSEDVDLARINYDSNGENGHWLLEPTSTNLVGLSEFINPSQAGWAEVATNTYTNNYSTAPDGNQTSTRVQFVNPNSSSQLFYLFNSTSGEYSASIYAKGSGTLKFGFYDNASVLTDEITLTSEWQRFEVTKTLQTTSNARFWIYPEGASAATDIEIWGAQSEALSYATSYIPTYGSTVTRATETLNGSGNSTLINSTEGVLYAEIAALADDADGFRVLGISDGGASNRIFIGYNDSNQIYGNIGTSTLVGTQYIPTNASNLHKVALKYENNNCKFFVDGTQIGATLTSVTIPSGMNSLQFNSGAGGSVFYGDCKALAVFDEALTDDELELLTGITNYGSFNELAQANGYTII